MGAEHPAGAYPLTPVFAAMTCGTILGLWWQYPPGRRAAACTIAGGAIGGVIALVVHLAVSYTVIEHFEDEGLGFLGSLIALSPFFAVCGAIIGSIVWTIAWVLFGRREGKTE